MNFRVVLTNLLSAFEEESIRYALIGGYALGLWGVSRGTVDLDFLVDRDSLPALGGIMARLGYVVHHRSENVSQYMAGQTHLGSIDFLHAFRAPTQRMLASAASKTIYGNITIKVVRVEDLIGLKVQAIANNPARKVMDLADISSLLCIHGPTLDWQLLDDYFSLFNKEDLLAELKEQHQCA